MHFLTTDRCEAIQVPPRHVAYALKKPLKKELEILQQHQILALIGVDEMAEWSNNFVIVPKPNGTLYLYLDLVRLNQVLIRPIHRDPILNDILPKLTNVHYITITDASSGYQKPDKKSSYLITFVHNLEYRFTR